MGVHAFCPLDVLLPVNLGVDLIIFFGNQDIKFCFITPSDDEFKPCFYSEAVGTV